MKTAMEFVTKEHGETKFVNYVSWKICSGISNHKIIVQSMKRKDDPIIINKNIPSMYNKMFLHPNIVCNEKEH